MNMMNPSMKIDNSLVKHGKKYQAKSQRRNMVM